MLFLSSSDEDIESLNYIVKMKWDAIVHDISYWYY